MVILRRQQTNQQPDQKLIGTTIRPSLSPKYGTPEGRVPFGDGSSGWYHTPETIEPTDCVNYRSSPWCGGNPFSKNPIKLDVKININPCGVDINVQGTLLYTKLPTHGISYRRPGDCRNDPPPKTEPTPQPGQINYKGFDIAVDSKIQVFAFITNSQDAAYTYTNPGGCGKLSGISFATPEGWVSSCSNFRCPGDLMTVSGNLQQTPVGCTWRYEVYSTGFKVNNPHPYTSGTYCSDQPYRDSTTTTSPANYNTGAYIFTYIHDEAGNIRQWKTNDGQASTINYSIPATYETSYCEPYRGMPLRIWKGYYRHIQFFAVQPRAIEAYKTVTVKLEYVVGVNCSYPLINPYDNNPPPPLPPPKDCCMSCCTQTTQENDYTALLQQILAEVRIARQKAEDASAKATQASEDAAKAKDQAQNAADQAKKAADGIDKTNQTVGVDEFPASLPEGLSSTRSGMVTLKDIPQLVKQLVIYLDELIGQIPVTIKIQDSDLVQEGEQPVELTCDNLIELCTEHFGFTINTSINSELLVQLTSKVLIELTVLRKQLHTLQSSHEALVKYEGYDVRESFEEVPFSITPNVNNEEKFPISQFLKESTQKVVISVLEEKEIGRQRKFLLFLEKAASVIFTVFWRKLEQGKDLVSQIKSVFNQQNQVIDNIDSSSDDLEDWLKEYENGFTNSPGYEGDRTKPWGEDYEARPKTKIIKKTDPPNMKG